MILTSQQLLRSWSENKSYLNQPSMHTLLSTLRGNSGWKTHSISSKDWESLVDARMTDRVYTRSFINTLTKQILKVDEWIQTRDNYNTRNHSRLNSHTAILFLLRLKVALLERLYAIVLLVNRRRWVKRVSYLSPVWRQRLQHGVSRDGWQINASPTLD